MTECFEPVDQKVKQQKYLLQMNNIQVDLLSVMVVVCTVFYLRLYV